MLTDVNIIWFRSTDKVRVIDDASMWAAIQMRAAAPALPQSN
jgi:hypothetical protein